MDNLDNNDNAATILLSRLSENQVNFDSKFDRIYEYFNERSKEINSIAISVDKLSNKVEAVCDKVDILDSKSHNPPCHDAITQLQRIENIVERIKRLEDKVNEHLQEKKKELEDIKRKTEGRWETIFKWAMVTIGGTVLACLVSGLKLKLGIS